MRAGLNKANFPITLVVEQILATGRLTRQQHLYLTTMLLSGQKITSHDRLHINRILESVQTGQLQLVD